MVFIFATGKRNKQMLEHDIGPCPFGCNVHSRVDVIEYHSQTLFFGFIPTKEQVNKMVKCRTCGKCIKEEYYTMRDQQSQSPAQLQQQSPPQQVIPTGRIIPQGSSSATATTDDTLVHAVAIQDIDKNNNNNNNNNFS